MFERRRHKEAQPEQNPAQQGFPTDLDPETFAINILSSLRLFLKLSISQRGDLTSLKSRETNWICQVKTWLLRASFNFNADTGWVLQKAFLLSWTATVNVSRVHTHIQYTCMKTQWKGHLISCDLARMSYKGMFKFTWNSNLIYKTIQPWEIIKHSETKKPSK